MISKYYIINGFISQALFSRGGTYDSFSENEGKEENLKKSFSSLFQSIPLCPYFDARIISNPHIESIHDCNVLKWKLPSLSCFT